MIIGPVSKHGNSLNSNVCLGTLSHCIDFTSVHLSQSGLVVFFLFLVKKAVITWFKK